MISIKVLGPGCAKCQELERRVRRVVHDGALAAEIEKITDHAQMLRWNLNQTPGLVINDVLVVAGRVPPSAEIAELLSRA